jgi:hypothetical protein
MPAAAWPACLGPLVQYQADLYLMRDVRNPLHGLVQLLTIRDAQAQHQVLTACVLLPNNHELGVR